MVTVRVLLNQVSGLLVGGAGGAGRLSFMTNQGYLRQRL